MGALKDFYTTYLANSIADGELTGRKSLSALGIKPLFNRIVTRKYIKRVICIEKIPYNYDKSLVAVLNKIAYDFNHNCKIYINTYSMPCKVDVKDKKFLDDMHAVENRYKKYKSVFDEFSETDQITGRRISLGGGLRMNLDSRGVKKLEEDYNSYKYVYKEIKEGEQLATTFLFIEIVASKNKIMKEVINRIEDYLTAEEFLYSQLSSNSSYYMANYSPASFSREFPSKEFGYCLTSSENIARFIPYNCDGFIGDGYGTLIGINLRSMTPFILNMFASGHSQINVVLGPSGTGKTYLAEFTAPGFVSQGIHCSAIDVKGREWPGIKKIIPQAIVIDISETSNVYVNTLRIDDVFVKDPKDAEEFYDISFSATINLCKILVDYDKEEESVVDSILRTCVSKVYSTRGIISNNYNTFKYSRDLNYGEIINVLESLKSSSSYSHNSTLINKMRLSLDSWFKRSKVFKGKELALKDIIESPMIIYTLNKNDDQSQTKVDSIRAFMISYLDMKKIALRKKEGKGTVCYYEELQRKEEFLNLISFIAAIVTGARSNNVAVFLLCNTIGILKEKDMRPISSNINNYFVSPLRTDEDYEMLESINCGDMVEPLRHMGDNPEQFDHVFYVKYDTGVERGSTLVKTFIHDKYKEIFKSRDTLDV